MKERKKLRPAQVLSALAVTLSLLFVGLEVRQNTKAMRGATIQAISDGSSDLLARLSTDERLSDLLAQVIFDGSTEEDFEPGEYIQLAAFTQSFVRQLENTYLQNREGIVLDEVFNTYTWGDPLLRTAWFAEWWEVLAEDLVGSDFKGFLESRVQFDSLVHEVSHGMDEARHEPDSDER